ncbi:MAG: hypothetical protein ABSA01_13175 [Anaerolineales bacterium]
MKRLFYFLSLILLMALSACNLPVATPAAAPTSAPVATQPPSGKGGAMATFPPLAELPLLSQTQVAMVESLPTLTQPQVDLVKSLPTLSQPQIDQLVQSGSFLDVGTGTPTPKWVPYIHNISLTPFPGFPTFTPPATINDVSTQMLYKGQPWEQMPKFFLVPNCQIPYTFPVGTFSDIVTVDKPLTLKSFWMAWINYVQSDGTWYEHAIDVGPVTDTVFTAAGQQKTFTQDIPLSLTCGNHYQVVFGMNVGNTGGFDLMNVVITSLIKGQGNGLGLLNQNPTLIPTLTNTPTLGKLTFTPNLNANCHTGPALIFDVLDVAPKGQSYPIDGRNLAGDWVRIMLNQDRGCWVLASSGIASGDLSGVRVLISPPTPTPTFTIIPTTAIDCSTYTTKQSCGAVPVCKWQQINDVSGLCTHK